MAGCGGPRKKATTDPFVDDFDASKEYTINFFGWGDDQEQDIYKRIIKDFEAQYPNVHVKYDATAAGEYLPALTGKIDSLPDVFYLPDTEFLQWADSGRLLNLLDAEGALEDELSAIWENAVNEYYYNPQTYTLGKSEGAGLYALPKEQGPYTLGYNKTPPIICRTTKRCGRCFRANPSAGPPSFPPWTNCSRVRRTIFTAFPITSWSTRSIPITRRFSTKR